MPISANKLIYDLERKLNAVDSGRANDYRIIDLVSFINDAYEVVIEHMIAEKDQNETIRNHLRPLLVPRHKLECVDTDDCNVCEITYPDNFYELLNVRAEVCKDCCSGTKEFPVPKPQGDDIDEARRNPYRKANYYYEQLLSYETTNGLRLFHENEMDILSVYIDFYRKITRIEAPELVECPDHIYKNWDGALINNSVNFEIDSTYINRAVTDVAHYLATDASKDFAASNESIKRILQLNQVHK